MCLCVQVRCPFDFKPVRKRQLVAEGSEGVVSSQEDLLYGIERISRHATFWSFGLSGFGIHIHFNIIMMRAYKLMSNQM